MGDFAVDQIHKFTDVWYCNFMSTAPISLSSGMLEGRVPTDYKAPLESEIREVDMIVMFQHETSQLNFVNGRTPISPL